MEELRGYHGIWRIDDEAIRIRFDSGRRVPTLFKALGGCTVPLAAVRDVDFDRGDRKRGWRLRLELARGTDPYVMLGVSARDELTPLVLAGPHDRELVAEYVADRIRAGAHYVRETLATPPDRGEIARALVARPPLQVRTAEGSASFDGDKVRLQWDGWLASSAKEKEKSREYRLAEIESVLWHPPADVTEGCMRIVLRGVTLPEATALDNDFFTLASHGSKGAEETFLMAATLNAHIEGAAPAAVESGAGDTGGTEDIFAKIRELGRLHAEGLLTDEEFSTKKAELLDRL
ncbi:DUF4429 domain-containing protein [Nocardiopsis lambiniae]|uniref:DUF4429 domain-containing protein n=1 Tax=Nocardiopsis lambiniae TaxID=3075539 RepID=A0ABU2MEG0_9ACTN|nr:DUF4429 domain-containing protein [Nocardiopsis sp. DSM 44743]MDT0331083.1 DUF4429 domain-containing protein [Nocardiopsis sp. DSM 44743]